MGEGCEGFPNQYVGCPGKKRLRTSGGEIGSQEIGNERQMTTSVTECPGCHYRFNYEWIPGASFHSLRLGPKRIFKCPKCRELHKFRVMDFGSDPNLPTHGDNAETGIGKKIWALLLVPSLALFMSGAFLPVLVAQPFSYTIILLVLGIAWVSGYVVYLYRATK